MAKNVRQGMWWVRACGRSPLRRSLTTLEPEAAAAQVEQFTSEFGSSSDKDKSLFPRLTSVFRVSNGSRQPTSEFRVSQGENNLYRRLSALGGSDANAADTLDEWIEEGKIVKKFEIIGIVSQLRKYKKYKNAIQILDWLEKNGRELSPGDCAIYLDLIWKTEGIESAEKYFECLPIKARNQQTYGALLHCYCKEKRSEKALMLLEKMNDLDYISTPLVYNNIMALHISVGEPGKVPPLLEEMKSESITPDFHTYNFLMNSYASLKDFASAEKVLEEMQEFGVKCEWTNYTNLAMIFVKEGLVDKANLALKKAENIKGIRDGKFYHILISLYSQIHNRDGVYRVWKSLKSISPHPTNINYLVMLQALFRLGDTNELETYFAEWESSCISYDIRVASVVIDSYLERDMISKAEKLCQDAIKRGQSNIRTLALSKRTNTRTIEMFMKFILKEGRMDMALKYLEAASLLAKENSWKPSEESVNVLMKYIEETEDVDGAENLCNILMTMDYINQDIYDSLVRTYNAAGKEVTQMPQRLQEMGL